MLAQRLTYQTKVTRTFVIPPLAAGVEFWYGIGLSYHNVFQAIYMVFSSHYCEDPPLNNG